MKNLDYAKIFKMNPFNTEIKEGISLITAIKNRKDTFEEALQTWVTHEQIDEIIIVDWDSDESLIPLVQKYQNGKIILAIVKDQPKWILSQAYNLAARLSLKTNILKMDADIKILPGFFEKHVLKPGIFYTGNYRLGRHENDTHLNGLSYLSREDFFKINGYNEFIKHYGWDDTDLFSRLESMGLKRLDFDVTSLHHIEHQARTINQDPSKYLSNISDEEWARHNILANRYIVTNFENWSEKNTMLDFNIEVVDEHTMLCSQSGPDTNLFPPELVNKGVAVAIFDRLKELGIYFPAFIETQITREELIELFNLYLSKDLSDTNKNLFTLILKINELNNSISDQKNEEIARLNKVIGEKVQLI